MRAAPRTMRAATRAAPQPMRRTPAPQPMRTTALRMRAAPHSPCACAPHHPTARMRAATRAAPQPMRLLHF